MIYNEISVYLSVVDVYSIIDVISLLHIAIKAYKATDTKTWQMEYLRPICFAWPYFIDFTELEFFH